MIGARYEGGRTCTHCRERVVRLVTGRLPSRWLHAPNRLPCIDALTREVTGTEAQAAVQLHEVRGRVA